MLTNWRKIASVGGKRAPPFSSIFRIARWCARAHSTLVITGYAHILRLQHVKATGKSYVSPVPMSPPDCGSFTEEDEPLLSVNPSLMCLRNGALQKGLAERLQDIQRQRQLLDRQRSTWWVRRTLLYPLAMLALLALSTATALLAVQNTLELLIGIKALPLSTRVRTYEERDIESWSFQFDENLASPARGQISHQCAYSVTFQSISHSLSPRNVVSRDYFHVIPAEEMQRKTNGVSTLGEIFSTLLFRFEFTSVARYSEKKMTENLSSHARVTHSLSDEISQISLELVSAMIVTAIVLLNSNLRSASVHCRSSGPSERPLRWR